MSRWCRGLGQSSDPMSRVSRERSTCPTQEPTGWQSGVSSRRDSNCHEASPATGSGKAGPGRRASCRRADQPCRSIACKSLWRPSLSLPPAGWHLATCRSHMRDSTGQAGEGWGCHRGHRIVPGFESRLHPSTGFPHRHSNSPLVQYSRAPAPWSS